MAPPLIPRRTLLLALAAGLALRLYFFLYFPHIAGDTLVYGDIARNLLTHHIYGFTNAPNDPIPVRPTLIRLPGYPLFLAAIFKLFGIARYTPAILAQILADLLACVLLARLAARLLSSKAAIPALWLAVLCPFTANYTAAPLTETLTLFCITAAFYALERWQTRLTLTRRTFSPWFFALAAILAYAILLRPEQGILPAAVVPAVLWLSRKHRPLLTTATLCLLTILPLIPWTLRNQHTFHVFQPLAPRFANDPGEHNPDGFQRWYRTWAIEFVSTDSTYWNYDGADLHLADLPSRAFDTPAQRTQTADLFDLYNDNDAATPALDAAFNTLALTRIRTHPFRYYVLLPTARLLNMAFRPRTEMLLGQTRWWQAQTSFALFAFLYAALNFAYFALAAVTLIRRRWNKTHTPIILAMLATIAMRSALLLTLDNSEPRYTLEFFPILIVLAAAALKPKQPSEPKQPSKPTPSF